MTRSSPTRIPTWLGAKAFRKNNRSHLSHPMNGFGKGTAFSCAAKANQRWALPPGGFARRRQFISVAGNVSVRCTNNGAKALNGALPARRQRSLPVENKACNCNVINNLHPSFKPIYPAPAPHPKRLCPNPQPTFFRPPASPQIAARGIPCDERGVESVIGGRSEYLFPNSNSV